VPRWIALAVGALSLFNGLGAWHVLTALPALRELTIQIPLVVLLGLPLAWCVALAALSIGLLLKDRRAVRLFAPMLSLYALSRLSVALLAQSDYDRGRLGAQALLTALWIAVIYWYTWRSHRQAVHKTVQHASERPTSPKP
jgi:hypothetical protein